MNHVLSACKRDILEVYHHALDAVKPEKLLGRCVTFSDNKLIISNPVNGELNQLSHDLAGSRIHVIGGGKCVLGMAKGLAHIARETKNTHLFSRGCLSLPEHLSEKIDSSTDELLRSVSISCRFGSRNNLPDKNSVDSTLSILDCVSEASRQDEADGLRSLFIVLLSGGGSACLTNPKYITLGEKLMTIRKLVQGGADIKELNTFRRCFSGVKGGNLARFILSRNPKSKIVSLIISDVVGDPLESIASGPTCVKGDINDHHSSMAQILTKYNIAVPLIRARSELEVIDAGSVTNVILGNNKLAIAALTKRASELGYTVTTLGHNFTGSTDQILTLLLHCADELPSSCAKSLIVCGGESTVVKADNETWGSGGRTQEMALDYIIAGLSGAHSVSDNFVDLFFAGSTDGQDGPTDVAGSFASLSELNETRTFCLEDATLAKCEHDSNSFWSRNKPEWLVRTGPTGTNVMDLYMLARVLK